MEESRALIAPLRLKLPNDPEPRAARTIGRYLKVLENVVQVQVATAIARCRRLIK